VYRLDEEQIREWVNASQDPGDNAPYLDKYIYDVQNHQEYLELIGSERLAEN